MTPYAEKLVRDAIDADVWLTNAQDRGTMKQMDAAAAESVRALNRLEQYITRLQALARRKG